MTLFDEEVYLEKVRTNFGLSFSNHPVFIFLEVVAISP